MSATHVFLASTLFLAAATCSLRCGAAEPAGDTIVFVGGKKGSGSFSYPPFFSPRIEPDPFSLGQSSSDCVVLPDPCARMLAVQVRQRRGGPRIDHRPA